MNFDTTDAPKTVPLDALHRELGGKMVPFAGYDMPVQYPAGIMAEHNHTREKASLFDVSHMGQVRLHGKDATKALESLVPGDIAALTAGNTRYTMFTNDQGGILDDLMVTQHGDYLYLVINAGCKDADIAHLNAKIGDRCDIEVIEDYALLALQGPAAVAVMARYAAPVRHMSFMSAAELHISDIPCFVTRSGYTGEDGVEFSVPVDAAEDVARLLLDEPEVEAAGLGSRDSLRLEAGLCLYGSDITETTTPTEAGLLWSISKRRREEGGFPGAAVIQQQIADGAPRKRVGIKPDGKAPARAHTEIADQDGNVIGEITSGGFSPTLGGPIAMGYVDAAHAAKGTNVNLMVRGKAMPAQVTSPIFVEHRYFRD
ncbi:MAG: glycine cleavage system aminomethyltransferase GcvT [Rhodospirillales bacterium]|jgi:aminomethyltransferase|nr:glycine cleavage system aminomethyltransferase GcvT [Rhodospirillales bacterium]MBT4041403.1 glycine cleavage system aminomethyltransferase GcvT [Rhodospirillales bacterium]MBT5352314.1 glycine cleavage system aminomethyltransferase GcvT [Rhodospirillales bacterium]MBT5521037.1 glycine cleavage system aminomethyltransferase GcvT [Rhodospirillales bacterium]MBT6827871.1 glycine cleavage system aminomethyltransferase GcvT [Rhodospirillales bacterium]